MDPKITGMSDIKLYGAARSHKTQLYLDYLRENELDFEFLDVEEDEAAATELRSLYETGRLNFPTFMLKDKKLRNPSMIDLEKWMGKKDIKKP